jgi:hypothetical protein
MASLLLLSLLAIPPGSAVVAASAAGTPATAVSASGRATVRILPGARIVFDDRAQTTEHRFIDATVTVEDGSRRAAKLIEFQ